MFWTLSVPLPEATDRQVVRSLVRISSFILLCSFIGGCSRLYEPYPALSYTAVLIAEVPSSVLKSFRDNHPHTEIEGVILYEFHSKHAGFHDYNFRFHGPDGGVTTVAFDSDGDSVEQRTLPTDHTQWSKHDGP